MAEEQRLTIKYRPDVDGLRAIAVLSVLVFHFFPERLRGGFAGVDVFFVISGYLVTKIIFRQMEEGRFGLLEFYFNRARRLFPSLFIVLLSVFFAGLPLLFSGELVALARHVLAGTFFVSNVLLFTESGYFDASSDLKPLLHLWSLGVEEQFYIVWPFFIGAVFLSQKKSLPFILALVTLASFVFCVVMTRVRPDFAFYMLPSRLWELGSGGVLAIMSGRGSKIFASPPMIGRLVYLLPWIGFFLIILSFCFLHKGNGFPGWRAAVPVLGTLLVIGGGVATSSLNRLLAWPPLVYVGLISYPLYLWHWPLISYARIVRGEGVTLALKLFLVGLSFVFAVLSYELLEKRFKKMRFSPCRAAGLYAGMILFALLGAGALLFKGFPSRYSDYEKQISSRTAFEDGYKTKIAETCRALYKETELCAVSKQGEAADAILIGDSHANHLFPGLEEQFLAR